MRIQIINGPNINLLGKREPSIYGSVTFEDYLAELRKKYADVQIDYFQSNIEGELIDKIQQVGFDVNGIILIVSVTTSLNTEKSKLASSFTFLTKVFPFTEKTT